MQKSKAAVAVGIAILAGLLIMRITAPDPVEPIEPPTTTADARSEAASGSEHALGAGQAVQGDDADVAQPEPQPQPNRRGRRVEDLDERTLETRKIVSRSSKNWSWIRHRLSGAGEDAYPLRDEALQLLSDLRDAESDIDMADLASLQARSEELAARVAASPYVDGDIHAKLQDLQSHPIPFTP